MKVNTYPVHSLVCSHLLYLIYVIFKLVFVPSVLAQIQDDLICAPVRGFYFPVQSITTAVTLKGFSKGFQRSLTLCLVFLCCASVMEVKYCTQNELFKSSDCEVMAFVSDLFQWIYYISHASIHAGSNDSKKASATEVGFLYQTFHHRCFLTNGSTVPLAHYCILYHCGVRPSIHYINTLWAQGTEEDVSFEVPLMASTFGCLMVTFWSWRIWKCYC